MAEINSTEKLIIDDYLREEFLSDNFHHTSNAAAESFIRYRSRYFDSLMPNSQSDLENHISNLQVLINLMMDKGIIRRERIEENVAQRQKSLNYDMEKLFIGNLPDEKIKIRLDPEFVKESSHKYNPVDPATDPENPNPPPKQPDQPQEEMDINSEAPAQVAAENG